MVLWVIENCEIKVNVVCLIVMGRRIMVVLMNSKFIYVVVRSNMICIVNFNLFVLKYVLRL